MASGLCNPVADYKFEKITSGLRNPKNNHASEKWLLDYVIR